MIKEVMQWMYERKLVKPLFNILTFVVGLYCFSKAKDLHAAGEPWFSKQLLALLGLAGLLWAWSHLRSQSKEGDLSKLKASLLGTAAGAAYGGACYLLGLYAAVTTGANDTLLAAIYLTIVVVVGTWDAVLAHQTSSDGLPGWLARQFEEAEYGEEPVQGSWAQRLKNKVGRAMSTDVEHVVTAEFVESNPEPTVHAGMPTRDMFTRVPPAAPTTLFEGSAAE